MERLTFPRLLLIAAVIAVVIAVVLFLLMGVTAAVNAGGAATVSAGAAAWLSGLSSVALGAALLVGTLGLALLLTKGVEARLEKKHSSYLQFVGVGAGVLTGLMAQVLRDDPILAALLGAIVAAVSIGAAKVIQRWPVLGIVGYTGIQLAVVVGADLAGKIDVLAWLGARSAREWAMLIALLMVSVGVPLTVCLIERRWESPQWMLGERVQRASAWLFRWRGAADPES